VDFLRTRQPAIDVRNPVGRYQVCALAHLLDQHPHGQHGAHRIAVGARMGADQEALAVAESLQNRIHLARLGKLRPCAGSIGWRREDLIPTGGIHAQLLHRRFLVHFSALPFGL
jgi:hypothetical protein